MIRFSALLLALAAFTASVAQTIPASIESLDRIVAIVNDDVIVMSELDSRVEQVRAQLLDAGTPAPPYPVLQKQVLERIIMDRLQLQVADRSGIRVDDTALNEAINDMARSNGLTLREFRDILRRDGYDFAEFREQVRDQIRIAQVRQRNVGDRVFVSDRDIDNFLAMQAKYGPADVEYRLRHILVALRDGASPEEIEEARTRAEEILERLRNGADFGQTAVSYSDGQQAFDGGDLGWKKTSELPTIFADVVPEMKPGETSELTRSPSGFHIVQLAELRGHGQHVITQTHSRHILIRPNELVSDEDAQTRLEQLRLRIEGGEDFAELARSHSDDRASAIKGGSLGWLSPGDLVPRFEEVANRLQPGEVSEPFKSQFGWHIVQVVERRDYDNTEEVLRAKAREALRERKVEEEGQAWLRQIRDSAYVEYRLEE